MIKSHLTSIKSKKYLNRRNDHEIFIATLRWQEHLTIKISQQDMVSIISKEKDKTTSLYLPSDTNQFVQQKLSTNTHHILILLHRPFHKDSRTTGFAILRIFYEFILNFKVYSKNHKEVPKGTIHMSLELFR